MKYYLDNQAEVRLDGSTVGEVLRNLSARYPKIHSHLFDGQGRLRRHINLFVNTENIRDLKGLESEVVEDDVVKILPSVTGG